MNAVQEELYETAYSQYLSDNNAGVRQSVDYARENYPLSPLMPKFLFLEALTYVSEENSDKFRSSLRELIERYPDADVTQLSLSWMRSLDEGRQIRRGASNIRGWLETRLVADSMPTDLPVGEALGFAFDSAMPHFVLITFPLDSVNPNEMLFEVARYNFNTFTVRDFDISLSHYGRLGMIKVSGFADRDEADYYERLISDSDSLLLPYDTAVLIISEPDFNMLLRGGRSLADYIEANSRKTDEEVHRSVLPEDEYPSVDEMYAEPDDIIQLEN